MKFRKKPVTVEAFQMTKERRASNVDWPQWLHEAWQKDISEPGSLTCVDFPNSDGTDMLQIHTLEGIHHVGWGDWIIQGVKGELYPCKPDIFELTYESISTGCEVEKDQHSVIPDNWFIKNTRPNKIVEHDGKKFAVWDVIPGSFIEVEIKIIP